jgi:hypothetical protein
MNHSSASDPTTADLEHAASRCFKRLGLEKAVSLFNLVHVADACLRSLVQFRRNIPGKKEYSENSRTARKRKVSSNLMQDIAIELEDLTKALSPGGRFRRRELSFEAISALFGELPSGRILILSEPISEIKSDLNRDRNLEQIETMVRDGTYKLSFASASFSSFAAQLDYLNGLKAESGSDLRHSIFTLKSNLPHSFIDLVSTTWEVAPERNIAVKDIQTVLTDVDRLQLAGAAKLASFVVSESGGSKISFWDWSARSPVSELICNVLDFAWPAEKGLPKSTAKAPTSLAGC